MIEDNNDNDNNETFKLMKRCHISYTGFMKTERFYEDLQPLFLDGVSLRLFI